MTNTRERKRGETAPPPNRIQTPEDVSLWKAIIGEQNAQACIRALADGAAIWTFVSEEEIDACAELGDEDKKSARNLLRLNLEGSVVPFAGIVKRPIRIEDMSPTEKLLNGVKEYPAGGGGGQPSH